MKINIKLRRVAAFTLVEKIFGIAIVSIVAASFFAGVGFSFGVVQRVREETRATQLMVEKMEALRLYSWSQLNTPGFVPSGFVASYSPDKMSGRETFYRGQLLISSNAPGFRPIDASYGDDIRYVTLELQWTSGNIAQTRRMTTLVTQNGMQNYIY